MEVPQGGARDAAAIGSLRCSSSNVRSTTLCQQHDQFYRQRQKGLTSRRNSVLIYLSIYIVSQKKIPTNSL